MDLVFGEDRGVAGSNEAEANQAKVVVVEEAVEPQKPQQPTGGVEKTDAPAVQGTLQTGTFQTGTLQRLSAGRIKRSSSVAGPAPVKSQERKILHNALTTNRDVRAYYEKPEKSPAIPIPGQRQPSKGPSATQRHPSKGPLGQARRQPSQGPVYQQLENSLLKSSQGENSLLKSSQGEYGLLRSSQDMMPSVVATLAPTPKSQQTLPSPQQQHVLPFSQQPPLSAARVVTTGSLNVAPASSVHPSWTSHNLQTSTRSVMDSQEYIRRRLESSQVTRFIEEKEVELNSEALMRANKAMEMVALLEKKLEAQAKRAEQDAKDKTSPLANGKESPVSPLAAMSDAEKEQQDGFFLMAAQVETTHNEMENLKDWRAGVDAALSDLRTQFEEARQNTEARLLKLETETLGVTAAYHKVEAKVRAVQLSQDQALDSLKETLKSHESSMQERLERLESYSYSIDTSSLGGERSARGTRVAQAIQASPRPLPGVIRATVIKPAPVSGQHGSVLVPQLPQVPQPQPQAQQPEPQPATGEAQQTPQPTAQPTAPAQQGQYQAPAQPPAQPPAQGQIEPQLPAQPQPQPPAPSIQQLVKQPTTLQQKQVSMQTTQGVPTLQQQQMAAQIQQQLLALTASQLPKQPTPQASHMEAHQQAVQPVQQHQEQQPQQLQQQLSDQLERLQQYQVVQQKTQVIGGSLSVQAVAPQVAPACNGEHNGVTNGVANGVPVNAVPNGFTKPLVASPSVATAVSRGRAGFPGETRRTG